LLLADEYAVRACQNKLLHGSPQALCGCDRGVLWVTQMAATLVSLPASDSSESRVGAIAAVLPSQSPPPGIFNLRI